MLVLFNQEIHYKFLLFYKDFQPLPNDYKCKDKFLLVSVPAPNSIDPSKVGESWSQLEAQFKPQVVSKN